MNFLQRRRWALSNPWKYDLMVALGIVLFCVASFWAMGELADFSCWLGAGQCP